MTQEVAAMDKVRYKGTCRQNTQKDNGETRRWKKTQAERSVGQRQGSRFEARVTGSLGPRAVK